MIEMTNAFELRKLSDDVIQAIAEYKRMPTTLAADVADHLLLHKDGVSRIHKMIDENLRGARSRGDRLHEMELDIALSQLMEIVGPLPKSH